MTPSATSERRDECWPARYLVERPLASTDRSQLWLAQDRQSSKQVVVKEFLPEDRQGYEIELRCGMAMDDPTLLGCSDAFYAGPRQRCLVFPFMAGGTLRDRLDAQRLLSVDEALDCLAQLATALSRLWALGWIHCDLKAENVFIEADGRSYRLGDFGASVSIEQAGMTAHTAGTPAYRAPERQYDCFTPNSDLYSLGVLGYELVTGTVPFTGSVAEIDLAHRNGWIDYTAVQDVRFRGLVQRLLERDPTLRLSSADRAQALISAIRSPRKNASGADSTPLVHSLGRVRRAVCEEIGGTILEVLEYDDTLRWQLRAGRDTSSVTGLLPGARFAGVLADEWLFHSSELIGSMDPETGEATLLVSGRRQLMSTAVQGDRLLFRDAAGVWRLELSRPESAPDCLLRAPSQVRPLLSTGQALCALPREQFALVEGHLSDRVSIYERGGRVATYELESCVLDLLAVGQHLVALTLDTAADSALVPLLLEDDGVQRLPLPMLAHQYAIDAHGTALWLRGEHKILRLDASGLALAHAPEGSTQVIFCPVGSQPCQILEAFAPADASTAHTSVKTLKFSPYRSFEELL